MHQPVIGKDQHGFDRTTGADIGRPAFKLRVSAKNGNTFQCALYRLGCAVDGLSRSLVSRQSVQMLKACATPTGPSPLTVSVPCAALAVGASDCTLPENPVNRTDLQPPSPSVSGAAKAKVSNIRNIIFPCMLLSLSIIVSTHMFRLGLSDTPA